jgi:hypothetical protein
MADFITDMHSSSRTKDLHRPSPGKTRGWGTIFLTVGILILFIYVIGPMGLNAPMIKPIADFIEANNINANGYYYTDVAEFSDAEMHMKNSMGFAPKANK